MKDNLQEFIGVHNREAVSVANKKFNHLMCKVFKAAETVLGVDLDAYENVQHLIEEKRNADDSHSYFWDWFQDVGLERLKEISERELPDTEETDNLLGYREMILELDIESCNADNLFTSISDTITAVYEHIQSMSGHAATRERIYSKEIQYETVAYHVSGSNQQHKQIWVVNYNKSPAGKKQDFCYNVMGSAIKKEE
jgi:hypothetical protein